MSSNQIEIPSMLLYFGYFGIKLNILVCTSMKYRHACFWWKSSHYTDFKGWNRSKWKIEMFSFYGRKLRVLKILYNIFHFTEKNNYYRHVERNMFEDFKKQLFFSKNKCLFLKFISAIEWRFIIHNYTYFILYLFSKAIFILNMYD